MLLQSKDKNKKQEFKAQFTKHIKFNTLKKEIFLGERVARDINQLKDVCSSKNFNKIVKDLKKQICHLELFQYFMDLLEQVKQHQFMR